MELMGVKCMGRFWDLRAVRAMILEILKIKIKIKNDNSIIFDLLGLILMMELLGLKLYFLLGRSFAFFSVGAFYSAIKTKI